VIHEHTNPLSPFWGHPVGWTKIKKKPLGTKILTTFSYGMLDKGNKIQWKKVYPPIHPCWFF
jgi:hypothetical protein